MRLALLDRQFDATQNLLALDGRMQIMNDELGGNPWCARREWRRLLCLHVLCLHTMARLWRDVLLKPRHAPCNTLGMDARQHDAMATLVGARSAALAQ